MSFPVMAFRTKWLEPEAWNAGLLILVVKVGSSIVDRSSVAVSRACRAALIVTESAIVEPENVPKSEVSSAAPERAMRASTFASISVTVADGDMVSRLVSRACNAALTVWPSAMVEPEKLPKLVTFSARPVRAAMSSVSRSIASS